MYNYFRCFPERFNLLIASIYCHANFVISAAQSSRIRRARSPRPGGSGRLNAAQISNKPLKKTGRSENDTYSRLLINISQPTALTVGY